MSNNDFSNLIVFKFMTRALPLVGTPENGYGMTVYRKTEKELRNLFDELELDQVHELIEDITDIYIGDDSWQDHVAKELAHEVKDATPILLIPDNDYCVPMSAILDYMEECRESYEDALKYLGEYGAYVFTLDQSDGAESFEHQLGAYYIDAGLYCDDLISFNRDYPELSDVMTIDYGAVGDKLIGYVPSPDYWVSDHGHVFRQV